MKEKLKGISIVSIIIHSMIGIRIITIARDVSKYAKNDAWISMIIMYFIILATAYTFYWIALQYPGLNFSQINEVVVGKFLGKIFLIVIGIYVVSSVGLSLRLFAESLKLFLLDKTPTNVIMIIMLFACVYCLRKGIKTLSIFFDILLPFLLVFIVLLMLLPLSAADPKNILPVFHSGIGSILRGTIEIVDPVLSCGIIGYVLPYFENPREKNMKKYIFFSITLASIVYVLTIVIGIMVFGVAEIQYIIFPTIVTHKAINLQVQVFERTETLFMTAWIPTTLTTLIAYYLASVLNFKALFNTKKDNFIIYAMIPIALIIANIPENLVELFKFLQYNALLAQIINIVYLPVFALIVLFKVKRGKVYGKN